MKISYKYQTAFKYISGLFAIQFPTNPGAHSASTLFQTFGFTLGFIFSIFTCTYVKILFHLALTFVSLIFYLILLARNEQKIEKNKNNIELKENVLSENSFVTNT